VASGKSNGRRSHSARAQIQKITNPTGWRQMFQLRIPAPVCWLTMSTVLSELLIITTASTARARGIS
jgi:hypothetical protein